MALPFGKFDYARQWLDNERRSLRQAEIDALLPHSCQGSGSAQERARFVFYLHSIGATHQGSDGLRCAANHAPGPQLVEAYLSTGARRFLTADITVDAGHSPEVLDRLLAWGADPKSRTARGTTLFHTTRLNTVGDVQRLLDWGLDINAKGPTHSSNQDDTTPLKEAATYASTEVLEYMKRAGADVLGAGIYNAWSNHLEGQVWLLRNGAQLGDPGAALVALASRGDKALPVLQALHLRGVDLNTAAPSGETALGAAIQHYAPGVVQFLVESGVSMQSIRLRGDATHYTALRLARGLSEMTQPRPHLHGLQRDPPFVPAMDPDRLQRKLAIVKTLEHAGACQVEAAAAPCQPAKQ